MSRRSLDTCSSTLVSCGNSPVRIVGAGLCLIVLINCLFYIRGRLPYVRCTVEEVDEVVSIIAIPPCH